MHTMGRSNRTPPRTRLIPNLLLVALLLLAAGAVLVVAWYKPALRPVDPTASSTSLVKIDKGLSGVDVIRLLHGKRLIRSPLAAQIHALKSGRLQKLKAGYYDLSPALATPEILQTIAEGKVAQRRVVVAPGLRLTQIADRVAASGLLTRDDFLAAASKTDPYVSESTMPLPRGLTVEGYLCPATYAFAVGTPAHEIVLRMVQALARDFYDPNAEEIRRSGRSFHDLVTLASLVEREAALDDERPVIAGVLYNRLRIGMRLQCDATVQYALGKHKSRLLYSDLKVESPYNTYLHAGLPPGPICSPGTASLTAALRPAKHDYLFYVAKGGGRHRFTRTYEEHLKAIEAIRGGARGGVRDDPSRPS